MWSQLDLPEPTRAQYAIADYLQSGPKRLQIQAFRGVGKSWITGAFVLWTLFKDSEKKIKCLKKMHALKPKDSFPLSQLASIYYSEIQDSEKGKFYQDKANKINSNKFL